MARGCETSSTLVNNWVSSTIPSGGITEPCCASSSPCDIERCLRDLRHRSGRGVSGDAFSTIRGMLAREYAILECSHSPSYSNADLHEHNVPGELQAIFLNFVTVSLSGRLGSGQVLEVHGITYC